jgi:AAA+ superfamily predicted ATPase
LVQSLFKEIFEIANNPSTFVAVLIGKQSCSSFYLFSFFLDEVESLTAARKIALNGSEPSDSIRVVNAVLTQIDRLRKKSNVIIMTTSNITEAVGN